MNSIFSTQNETNSIAQIALTKKQQQENSGIKFGNVLFKEQLQTFNGIVNQNETTLAKTVVFSTAQNATQTSAQNSANSTNLNSQSDIFALKIEARNANESSNLLADMLASLDENSANPKLYGYSVDSKGFMGLDFNIAAGLPQSFKIHSSTLEELYNINTNDSFFKQTAEYYGQPSYYSNIDIAYTFKWNYALFSQLADLSFGGKTSFSETDLAALPKGYSRDYHHTDSMYDKVTQMPKLTAIYKDEQALKEAQELGWELFKNSIEVVVGAQELDWTPQRLNGEKTWEWFNPDMSMYKDGENYTLEALFVSFMNGNVVNGGQTQINPYIETMQRLIEKQGERVSIMLTSFEKLAKGEANLNDILKTALEKGLLDMPLYANEQGKRLSKMTNPTELENFYKEFDTAQANGYKPNQTKALDYINNLYKEFMPKIQALYAKYGV